MFGYGVASDANPEMYIEAVGECHLKYQQLISGALLEAVKSDTETKNILKGLYRKLLLPMMRLYLFH